jgi:DNA uptake protein ComE-like DNA-binding protein
MSEQGQRRIRTRIRLNRKTPDLEMSAQKVPEKEKVKDHGSLPSAGGHILRMHQTLGNDSVQRMIASGEIRSKLYNDKPNDYDQETGGAAGKSISRSQATDTGDRSQATWNTTPLVQTKPGPEPAGTKEEEKKGSGREIGAGKEQPAPAEKGYSEPAEAADTGTAADEKEEKEEKETAGKEKKKKEKKGPAKKDAKKGEPGAAEEAAEGPGGAAAFLMQAGAKAFKKVKRKIKQLGKNEKKHKTPKDKKNESVTAVQHPEQEPQSRANQGQVETVNLRTEPATNDSQARGTLDEEVIKATPKKIKHVDSFKNDGKAQDIRKMVMVNVRGQTQQVQQTYQDIGDVPEQEKPPAPPPIPEPEAAPPTAAMKMGKELLPQLPEEMTDLSNYEKDVEDQVAAEGLDPQELALVDSGPLAEANLLRGQIKEKVQTAPDRIRQKEKEEKSGMQQELDSDEKSARGKMKAKRKTELGKVQETQGNKKLSAEAKRKKVTTEIQRIYKSAKETVTNKLADLETESLKQFDEGQKAAADTFENTVKEDMRAYKKSRYGGTWGWTKRAKDWALGMDDLPRVKEIFEDARDAFVNRINTLITTIIDNTKTVITDCKDTIQKARDEIAALVEPLEPGLKKEIEAAQKEFTDRLNALDNKVNAKEKELKEKLDERRKLAIKKIDEKIKQMKEELKGVGHKAKQLLLKGALKILKWALEKAGAPVEKIMDFLRKAASAFWSIIKSPGTFLSNLIKAVFGGFKQFRKNIVAHLKKGLMDWLFGTMSGAGITIPEDFSTKSIFGLVMQILNITPTVIKQKIAVYIGQENVERIEKVWGHISTFIQYGPGGLWEQIKQYIADFRERALGGIRDWIKKQVIFGAIEYILSLFSPVSGIAKIGKMIYKIGKFIMERIRQIIDVLKAIVNSLSDIASGAIGSAIDWIEKTLGRLVPVAIGFLATLLNLSGISKVIRELLEKIRKPIHNALDKLIAKIAAKLAPMAGKVAAAGKTVATKAKAAGGAVVKKTKAVAGKLFEWWNVKKTFKQGDETHKVYFKGKGKKATIMMASTPWTLQHYLASLKTRSPKPNKTVVSNIEKKADEIDDLKFDVTTGAEKPMTKGRGEKIAKEMTNLAALLAKLGKGDARPPSTLVTQKKKSWGGDHDAKEIKVEPLSIHPGKLKGSAPRESSALWHAVNVRSGEYVKGHLLNHHLHGAGTKDFMTPITRSLNSTMESQVEGPAKQAVLGDNEVLSYHVNAIYGTHKPVRKKLPAENDMPTKLEFKVKTMKLKKTNLTGNKPGNWEKDADLGVPSSLPNTLPKDTTIGLPRILVNLSTAKKAQLITIPDIGPAIAQGIIDLRRERKKTLGVSIFHSYTQLEEVKGISPTLRADLEADSYVKLN